MTLSFEVERSELADSSKIPCYFRDDESDVKVQIKCSSVWERIFNDDPIRVSPSITYDECCSNLSERSMKHF